VDEALEHRLAAAGIERLAVEVVLDEVRFLDQLRRDRSGKVVALRVARRAQADVAVGVDDAVRREDAIPRDEV
jgi:acyl-coenzyme A synthetase/AMP-(fatty) acid ligase